MKKVLLSAVALVSLAACQTTQVETKAVAKQMEPAPLPKLLKVGASFPTKSNDTEATVEVLATNGDWQTIKMPSGATVELKADFTIPPRVVNRPNGSALKLTVKGGDYANFWPLKVGNKSTIDYKWESNGRSGLSTRYCSVLSQENITVAAGNFDTYKVQCYEGQGQWYERRTWYYSPLLETFVKMITEGRNASDFELAATTK